MQNFEDHIQHTNIWKSATTLAQRQDSYDCWGVRWSCLNELPYWDPTWLVVLNTMHCITNILEYHARQVWQLEEVAMRLDKKLDKDVTLLRLLAEALNDSLARPLTGTYDDVAMKEACSSLLPEQPTTDNPNNLSGASWKAECGDKFDHLLQSHLPNMSLFDRVTEEDPHHEVLKFDFEAKASTFIQESYLAVLRK